MDLRPINPFYKRNNARARTFSMSTDRYFYPYEWITPVIDRTQGDVDHAKQMLAMSWDSMTTEQRKEYLSGLKGCMNRSDFERIENNIQILLDVLEIDSSSYVEAVPEFLTEDYFLKMQENVEVIRSGYCVHEDTPQTPELPFNTWQKFNSIEKILADVYEVLSAQFKYYAGSEIYAGESVGLIL